MTEPLRVQPGPGISYQDLLSTDPSETPEVLRLFSPAEPAAYKVDVARYKERSWHEKEKTCLWDRVWQFACREEHIPLPGDHYVYDIADRSYLLVRQPDGAIKAFKNACLHRGRRLKGASGSCASLRCNYHGFTWALSGDLSFVPSAWDFPHVLGDKESYALPQVSTGTWQGFVFINPDPDAEPLENFLEGLSGHFDRWRLTERFVEAHVSKIVDANWKVAQEAFCEAFHVGATHPQMAPRLGDTNSQVDVWRNFSRVITPSLTPSPTLAWTPTEEEMFRAMLDVRLEQPLPVELPAGTSARSYAASMARDRWMGVDPELASSMADAELIDSIDYTVFPNFHPWGGINRIVYRFRPHGDDHRRSLMEVFFLSPFSGDRPAPARERRLEPGASWTQAPELGMLGKVFDQDEYNMHEVQRGLDAISSDSLPLGSYQEAKIRWLHERLDEFIISTDDSAVSITVRKGGN